MGDNTTKEWLADVSEELLDRGADLAVETDRWFVHTVRWLGRNAQRVEDGLGTVAQAALASASRLRPLLGRKTPRERIRDLLLREAARLDFDVSRQDFVEFSEKMAALLEMVFSGTLRVEDVAFDPADADATSVEVAEEVSDEDQGDQPNEGDALHVQQ